MPAIMMADPGSMGTNMGPRHSQANLVPGPDMRQHNQDLENLTAMLTAWNANRLDLFALSMPNEKLEFHGVMRFYYQNPDPGSGQKVATKCIRVTSTADAKQIIETLIEKFRPDMKMLEVPEYALYEIHESGERRIGLNEKPLLVQLSWHHDDREGRFLLRRIDEASLIPKPTQEDSSFKRKLSKREKKELKKQEKKEKVKDGKHDESMADKLYTELPDTSFTRSISNPEAVMRRRRQQKLEKKLQQFRSKDGGPDTGGTLKIYGDSLRKDVPYKTLLLSVHDTAGRVVEEMLDKYAIDRREAPAFCLVQSNLSMPDDGGEGQVVGGGTTREYILEDDECPLHILMNHQRDRGAITFHVKRRSGDSGQRRRKKKPGDALPYLEELSPGGGNRMFRVQPSVTEVGSEVGPGGVQLPGLLPRHCIIHHTEGAVTVTPCPHAEVVVNNHRITETTILQHGCVVKLGKSVWRFIDPAAVMAHRHSMAQMPGPGPMSHHGSTATLPGPDHMGPPGMRSSTANYVSLAPGQQRPGKDAILPAVLEFREETEREFFNALTFGLDPGLASFKLAPTYTIYMATRFRASTHYRPELVPEERAVRLTDMLNRTSDMILSLVKQSPNSNHAPTLSFWMANASELLHFLKSDRHITAFSLQAQDMLAEAVHEAFKKLVIALQAELEHVLPQFLSETDQPGELDQNGSTHGIIAVFSSAMGLLRKCRVNAALTIQLFSQLFHFVNMWTFNILVTDQQLGLHRVNYCTHTWGLRLKRRLHRVELWAEKQGLELAADCHLARIQQAAHLLQARKSTAEDIATLSSTCFKLNSLQLESLLSRYQPAEHEEPISQELIQTIVRVAHNTVDELTRREQRQVRLEEDFVLQLPFLLPEDNYSCDIIRGVPGGLVEFIAPLQRAGLCVMTPQPTSSGSWTIYLDTPPPLTPVPGHRSRSPSEMSQVTFTDGPGLNGHTNGHNMSQSNGEPEIQSIRLSKTNGMGLSIVAAKGNRNDKLGIYIKAVVEGGAAWQDGRLQAGDQLLACDGQSLVGITQERAAQLMMGTGPVVTLDVAKLGAFFDGLDQLLLQPSPVLSRHGDQGPPPGPRRPSGPPGPHGPLNGPPGPPMGPPGPQMGPHNGHMLAPQLPGRIPQSKSTPALHQASPGTESQHNYQNQEWISAQLPPRNGPQPPPHPGQSRSASVQNLRPGSVVHEQHPEMQQFYQNIGQNRPRFGSQTSLNGPQGPGPVPRDRPMSALYPPGPGMRAPGSGPPRHVAPPMSSNGPEKPQRQFSYELEDTRQPPVRQEPVTRPGGQESGRVSVTRVRFQDPQTEVGSELHSETHDGSYTRDQDQPGLSGLRMTDIESEFRRRVEECSEDSDDEDNKMSTIKRNGVHPSETREHKEERKRSELEERLTEMRRRSEPELASPPPLPNVPPPAETPPPAAPHPAHRLDILLGNNKQKTESPGKNKKVSFMAEEVAVSKFEYNDDDIDDVVNSVDTEEEQYDDNDNNLSQENLETSHEDPNAFISAAETLLSGQTLSKLEVSHVTTTHTPSVIGTQEVYRDPRSRRLAQEQERKISGPKQPDGAKLSFQEKMKLFAQEAGEKTPRDKAKISKAQREIDD